MDCRVNQSGKISRQASRVPPSRYRTLALALGGFLALSGLWGDSLLVQAAGAGAQAGVGKGGLPTPKLVVLLVADQFWADNLTRMGALLEPGGLKKLLKGATAIGHYGQQNTYTGPGHALIATGSYGYLNGITQNKFWNQKSGHSESMLYDNTVQILGEKDQSFDDDTSPRNLIGSTLFDELRLLHRDAKVVTVALKGRGAILLAGHLGQAYFFSDQTGEMTTSTFYASKLPDWVQRWNSQKLVDKAFGAPWERLLPADKYPTPDDSPYESNLKGLGRTFPHPTKSGLSARSGVLRHRLVYAHRLGRRDELCPGRARWRKAGRAARPTCWQSQSAAPIWSGTCTALIARSTRTWCCAWTTRWRSCLPTWRSASNRGS